MILLCEDRLEFQDLGPISLSDAEAWLQGGKAHVLAFISRKAKRISYSTSHAETLSACGGLELGQLIALRLAEVLSRVKKFNAEQMIALGERGGWPVPIDQMAD